MRWGGGGGEEKEPDGFGEIVGVKLGGGRGGGGGGKVGVGVREGLWSPNIFEFFA